jgi:hypothetical protein
MALVVRAGGAATGSWTCRETQADCAYRILYVSNTPCVFFADRASGTFFADGSVSLSLHTDATHVIGVDGTVAGKSLSGTALFSDSTGSLNAYGGILGN